MEADAHIHTGNQKFIRPELRDQGDTVRVIGPWRTTAVVLRKSVGDGRLPGAEIQFLLRSTNFFHRSFQFAFKIEFRDLSHHGSQQGKIPGVSGGRHIAEDIPSTRINAERRNSDRTFAGMAMAYLGGSAFLEWLEHRSGEDSLRKLWARMTARQRRSFDQSFEGVFGDSPERLYGKFTAELTERAMIVVTHYQRLLNYIVPDYVHVMDAGRIVKTGGKELALELEAKGYAQYHEAAA